MESDDFNRIIKNETSSSFLNKENNNVSEEENTYKFTDTFFTEKAEGAVTSVKDVNQNIEEKKEEEDEIPILDDLIQAYSSPNETFHDIDNKEKKLSNYISKAYYLEMKMLIIFYHYMKRSKMTYQKVTQSNLMKKYCPFVTMMVKSIINF